MNDNLNINKACRKYLLKDTDVRLNIILTLLIAIGFNFLLYDNLSNQVQHSHKYSSNNS